MILFKHVLQAKQFKRLLDINPQLAAVISYVNVVAEFDHGVQTVITSLHRPDDTDSYHSRWAAVDLRIFHPDRPVDDGYAGWSEDEAEFIIDDLKSAFRVYAAIHGDGMDKHVHIQIPLGLNTWEMVCPARGGL